jgi:hypothetical protein
MIDQGPVALSLLPNGAATSTSMSSTRLLHLLQMSCTRSGSSCFKGGPIRSDKSAQKSLVVGFVGPSAFQNSATSSPRTGNMQEERLYLRIWAIIACPSRTRSRDWMTTLHVRPLHTSWQKGRNCAETEQLSPFQFALALLETPRCHYISPDNGVVRRISDCF